MKTILKIGMLSAFFASQGSFAISYTCAQGPTDLVISGIGLDLDLITVNVRDMVAGGKVVQTFGKQLGEGISRGDMKVTVRESLCQKTALGDHGLMINCGPEAFVYDPLLVKCGEAIHDAPGTPYLYCNSHLSSKHLPSSVRFSRDAYDLYLNLIIPDRESAGENVLAFSTVLNLIAKDGSEKIEASVRYPYWEKGFACEDSELFKY